MGLLSNGTLLVLSAQNKILIVGSVWICIFILISSIIFQFQIINVLGLDLPTLLATPVIKAVIKYTKADTQNEQISIDNRGKCGIYRWTRIETSESYVASSVNLSRRLRDYFSPKYLERANIMYICIALLKYGYSYQNLAYKF
jgi:hypothetical protein